MSRAGEKMARTSRAVARRSRQTMQRTTDAVEKATGTAQAMQRRAGTDMMVHTLDLMQTATLAPLQVATAWTQAWVDWSKAMSR